MVRHTFLFIVVFFSFIIGGCSAEYDQIFGYWKSTKEKTYATYSKTQVYVISKTSIAVDSEESTDDITYKEKDGKIFGKSENSPFEKFEIQIIDDNRIIIWRKNPMTSANADGDEFVRTTKEDAEAIIKSPGRKHEYEPIKLFD